MNTGVPQGSILGHTLFYYTLMTFLAMLVVILLLLSGIAILLSGSIDVKMDGSVLEEKSYF